MNTLTTHTTRTVEAAEAQHREAQAAYDTAAMNAAIELQNTSDAARDLRNHGIEAIKAGDVDAGLACLRDHFQARQEYSDLLTHWRTRLQATEAAVSAAAKAVEDARELTHQRSVAVESPAEVEDLVSNALRDGEGLRVDLDAGEVELWGEELRTWWEDLAPGESMEVIAIVTPR